MIRQAARRRSRASGILTDYPNIDGVFALAHGTGCGMASEGPGWDNLQRVLWGYATHPNVGAAVFVGLGCEVMQVARMKVAFDGPGAGKQRFHGLTIQESGGTRATIAAIRERIEALLPEVNDISRSPCPASDLCVALQCGGSDGYSGITANPALGFASDLLVAQGGTVIPCGDARDLRRRTTPDPPSRPARRSRKSCWSGSVGGRAIPRCTVARWTTIRRPVTKAGGLTTILEKSLGAVGQGGGGAAVGSGGLRPCRRARAG